MEISNIYIKITTNGIEQNKEKLLSFMHFKAYSRWHGFRHRTPGMDLDIVLGKPPLVVLCRRMQWCLFCFLLIFPGQAFDMAQGI